MAGQRGVAFHVRVWCSIIALGLGTSTASMAGAGGQQVYEINLPAQSVADALNALSEQTNVPVVFPYDLVSNCAASAVLGKYTLTEALAALLAGTGLSGGLTDKGVLTVSAGKSHVRHCGETHVSNTEHRRQDFAPGHQGWRSIGTFVAAGAPETALQTGVAKKRGWLGRVLATVSMAIAGAAQGQEAGQTSGPSLEEVIVTATKRAENIQDIPLSISAFGKVDLEQRGVSGLSDILRSVPGVYMHDNDGFNSAVVIRGLTQTIFYQNTGAGPTVGTYLDETPITFVGSARVGAVEVRLADVERVEVLRGPQGTTFGDAALTGAVRIIPVAPKLDEAEGSFVSEYSHTGGYGGDNNKLEGVLNLPLVADKLAVRASLYRHDNSGFYKTVGASDPQSIAFHTAMGSLDYAADRDDQGANIAIGGRAAILWQATENLSFEAAYFDQEVEQNGQAWAEVAPYKNIHLSTHPAQRLRGHDGAVTDSQIDISSLKVRYDTGRGELLASTSWMNSGVQWNWPAGPVFNLPWSYLGIGTSDSFTAEVRFASELQGPLQFIAGVFHEEIDATHRETTYHVGTPETNFFYDDPLQGDSIYSDNKEQNAAFGEVSFDLTDTLRLTGGARYYEYERRNTVELIGGQFGFDSPEEGDGGNAFSLKSNGTNYKVDLSYRPNEDTLIYGLWSQGFRLGRAQPGVAVGICDPDGDGMVFDTGISVAQTRKLESDSLDNYEIGAKSSIIDGRVTFSAAVFRDEWTGIPTLVHMGTNQGPAESAACIADINVGEAKATGVEFQAGFLVTRSLRVDLGGAYVDAFFEQDAPGIGVEKGDRLPNAPKLNWNLSANYEFDAFQNPSYVRLDYAYVGSFLSNTPTLPPAGDYYTVDASVGMSIGKFNASLFVQNLTNEAGVLYPFRGGQFAGAYTRPRTIGVRLSYDFLGR